MTRLGKAKKALKSVIESENATKLRMALQRFPQNLGINELAKLGPGSCGSGGWMGLTKWYYNEGFSHEIDAEKFTGPSKFTVWPAPFTTDGSVNTSIMQWIDFKEEFEIGEKSCELLAIDCPNGDGFMKACLDSKCAVQTEPELHGNGQTPIGRSLFYAGEYLRHAVVLEGQACTKETGCASPHYSCVDGKCHDPFRKCRPNLIVVFTDGGESTDTWAETKESSSAFFNPRVQAKRLHYGLGCASDNDCVNGAKCVGDVCNTPGSEIPEGICHLTNIPCQDNKVCFDYKYKCGPAQTCSGECEASGLNFVDTKKGKGVIRDANGDPIAATVHVVDAATSITGNSVIAAMGGGKHVPVNFENVSSIVDAFLPLLDIKTSIGGCE